MTHGRTRQLRQQQRRRRARGSSCFVLTSLATCIALCSTAFAQAPDGLPTGGNITAGAGSIAQSGANMTVTQSTERMVADWNSFGVGANAAVNFAQPSAQSIALNRVLGADPSSIQGRLSANGRIFLLNPNGVIFGSNAHVDVGGIVASSQSLSNEDFLNGNYRFSNATGGVLNQGTITAAPQGYVVLSGTTASNEGTIDAAEGTAALVAGESMTLEVGSTGLLSVSVDAATLDALAKNTGVIRADGGVVFMLAESASTVPGMVLGAGGTIQAQSITQRDGKIYLDGGTRGEVYVTGTLGASAETSGVRGGDVTVLGENIALLADAHIDTSGDAGGGTVLIGGNWQGKGPERNASAVVMDEAATIKADATANGDGGTVVLWSDDYTNFQGSITARGGALSGDGGQVETSSKDNLQTYGAVDAAAPLGNAGAWLLDPSTVTISATATTGGTFNASSPNVFMPSSGAANSNVLNTTINASLSAGTSVTINTVNTGLPGAGLGDITVSAAITKSGTPAATPTLNLVAVRDVVVDAAISSNSGAMNVVLNANATSSGNGYVTVSATGPITTNGGTLTIGGTPGASGHAFGNFGQTAGVSIAAALSTGAGAVIIRGTGNSAGGNGVTITATGSVATTGGAVNITGTGRSTGTANGIGVLIANGTVTAGGLLTITGNATGTGTGTTPALSSGLAQGNVGVSVQGDNAKVSGAGITILGTSSVGAASNDSGHNYGVSWEGTGAGTGGSINAPSGNILITGTGGNDAGTGDSNWGIVAWGPLTITGTGTLTLTGLGSDSDGSSNNGVGSNSAGVLTSIGALTITGTAGNGTGPNNYGVQQAAALTSSGNITIAGNGGDGASSSNAHGYFNTNAPVTSGGNVDIKGFALGTTQNGDGVLINGAAAIIRTSGSGTISIEGRGRSTGTTNRAIGLNIINGQVTSLSGNITLTGTNSGSGADTDFGTVLGTVVLGSVGVSLEGSTVKVSTGGAGTIDITGSGGGGTTSTNNHGVYWETANAIDATGTGAITVVGTAGGNSGSAGTGANNYGIAAFGSLGITGTGLLTVTGTGGNSTGNNNYGFWQNAAIVSNGDITLKGTGGNRATADNARGYYNAGAAVTAALNHHISITGIGGTLADGADGLFLSGAGAVISTTGNGTIALTGEGHATGANRFAAVRLTSAKVSAQNGNITISGGAASTGGTGTSTTSGSATIGNVGFSLEGSGAKISTTGGNITITGKGNSTGTGASNFGVFWETVDAFNSGSGTITIVGTGADGTSGTNNIGVYQTTNGSLAVTGNGNLSITGTGGNGAGDGSYGVYQTAALSTTGGTLFVKGTGGATGAGDNRYGFRHSAGITSNGGNITLEGISGGTGTSARGYRNDGYAVSASGTAVGGNISITGTASPSGTGGAIDGLQLIAPSTTSTNFLGTITLIGTAYGTTVDSRGVYLAGAVTAVNGLIKITGTNLSTSEAAGNSGVFFTTGSSVVTSGAGGVNIEGTGGGRGAGGANYGVSLAIANAIQATSVSAPAAITIKGTGGGAVNTGVANSGDSNYGVLSAFALTGNGGLITITGTGGATSGADNVGVRYNGAITNVGAGGIGGITIVGTGAGTGATAHGYYNPAQTVSSVSGPISITGTGAGVSGLGVYFSASAGVGAPVSTGGTGTITINGVGSVSGANVATGVRIRGPITTVDGTITIVGSFAGAAGGTGTLTTSGATTVGNVGVLLESTGKIATSGIGSIDITGTGGSSTAASNYGVSWEGTNTIGATGTQATGGNITIKGTGGSSAVASNAGVYQRSALATTGTSGSITINGTGGGTGATDHGYVNNGFNVTAQGGDISFTGLGAGSGGSGIVLTGGTTSTLLSGKITMLGTSVGATAASLGVNVTATTISAVDGLISIKGTSGSTATAASNYGVLITSTSSVTAVGAAPVTGGITVEGIGGGSGAGGLNFGVSVEGPISSGGGPLSVKGTGGGGTGLGNRGISQFASITNAGAGTISINATGGGSGSEAHGYYNSSSQILSSGTGPIVITGIAAGTAANGVYSAGAISTGGTGLISVHGTGSSSGVNNAFGVRNRGTIIGANGALSVVGDVAGTGTGNSFTFVLAAPIGNAGVTIEGSGAVIKTTGSGTVTVEGTGLGVGAGLNNFGVYWEVANAIGAGAGGSITIKGTGGGAIGTGNHGINQSTAGSLTIAATNVAISMEGIGGGSGGSGSNVGVLQNAAVTTAGGAITIKGTGGGGSSANTVGYAQNAALTSAGGAIELTGIASSSTGTGATGYSGSAAAIAAGGGNIKITGTGAPGSPRAFGISIIGAIGTTGGGTIELIGTGHSSGANQASGVRVTTGGSLAAVNGLIKVTGLFAGDSPGGTVTATTSTNGAAIGNVGVAVEGTATIKTSGTGSIEIEGTGGGSTAANNYGVFWEGTSSIGVTGAPASGGSIKITGTGGGSSGAGNIGVYQSSALATNGTVGAITIKGTGGGTGQGAHGYQSNGFAVTTPGGNIEITGDGGPASLYGYGVNLTGAISTTGAGTTGTITIIGTGVTTPGTGFGAFGVRNLGAITAVGGRLWITGTVNGFSTGASTTSNGTPIGSAGVTLEGSGAFKTTGAGEVRINGTGKGGSTTGRNYGVYWEVLNGINTGAGGQINITGTGGSSVGTNEYGVYQNAALSITGSAAPISITGIGGAGGGSSSQLNDGVFQNAALTTSGGAITIHGTGGAVSLAHDNRGYYQGGALTSGGGNITLTGIGGPGVGVNPASIGYLGTAAAVTAGGGNILITGTGGANTNSAHGISIVGPISTTGTGTIELSGTGSSSGANLANGVRISTGGSLAAVNGLIKVTGLFSAGTLPGGTATATSLGGATTVGNVGVLVEGTGTVRTSGTGSIEITGTGGGSTGASNYGVFWEGTNSIGVTGAPATLGNITITGTGGGSGVAGADNIGVYQKSGLATTGTVGAITITGTGGGTGTNAAGYYNSGQLVTAVTGDISIAGTGSSVAAYANGINLAAAAAISTTLAGKITIVGHAYGASSQAVPSIAVEVKGVSTITAANGLIEITGTNHSTSTGSSNTGVTISDAGSTVNSTGTGGISITGTGGPASGASGSNHGVYGAVTNAVQVTGAAPITIVGTGGGNSATGGSNYGVLFLSLAGHGGLVNVTGTGGTSTGANNNGVNFVGAVSNTGAGGVTVIGTGGGAGGVGSVTNYGIRSAAISTVGAAISLTGVGGNTGGSDNIGVFQSGAILSAGGAITIDGTGGGTGSAEDGYVNVANAITAAGGNVSITGRGGSAASSGSGVITAGSITTTGSGTLLIHGTAHGQSTGAASKGVSLGGVVTAVNGLISVTGDSSGSAATVAGNYGVQVLAGGLVTSTGTGGISVDGKGGGSGAGGTNYGVYVIPTAGLRTTAVGVAPITVVALGGGSGGTGTRNYGAYLSASTAGTGAISITGSGGGGTGSNSNVGIQLSEAIIASSTGAITLIGTGGAGVDSRGIFTDTFAVSSQGGNIAVTGTTIGAGSGIHIATGSGGFTTIGSGTMTVSGTAAGSGASGSTGVLLEHSANVISTVNGALSVTGINNITDGSVQTGVRIVSGAQIKSTGAGAVTVIGTGGTSADVNNHGINNGGTLSVVGGALSITGHGRADGATGVFLLGGNVQSAGSGSITITATRVGVSAAALVSEDLIGGASATGDVVVNADDIGLSAQGIQTAGSISILPVTAGTTVGIGSSAGVLHVDDTELALLSWGAARYLTIGGANAAALSVTSSVTFTSPVWFSNASGSDITVAGTLASSAAGDAVVLVSGKNFHGGNISTASGRYLVYSVAPTRNTEGSLSGAPTRVFGKTIGNYAPGIVAESGNVMLYTSFGSGTITIAADDKTRVYGAADPTFTYVFSCLPTCIEADSLATPPTLTSDATIISDVGASYLITAAGAAVNDLYAAYDIVYETGAFEITPAMLTVTGAAVDTKVYDALLTATFSGGALAGVLNSDAITLNRIGAFATKGIGATKAVTTAFTLGGVKAANYTLTQPTGVTGAITARALTISGISAATRAYDATTVATLTGGTLSAVQQTDVVSLVSGDGTFDTKDIGTAKTVVATGYSISGTDAGNYTLTLPAGITADITPKALTISNIDAVDRVYDGGTTATLSGTPSLDGVLNSEAVALAGIGAVAFVTKGAGAAKAVTVTGYTISGAGIGNYSLTLPTDITAEITPKSVTVSLQGTVSKPYDGNAVAALVPGNYLIAGLVGGDDLTVTNTAGTYGDKNADTSKPVTVLALVKAGVDAGNYTMAASASGNVGQIDRVAVTITADDLDKIYGTADPAFTFTTTALVGAETASVFTGALARDDALTERDVGTYTIEQGSLTAQNYAITFVEGDFTIDPATLTVTATDASKTFGAADPVSFGYTSTGLAAWDDALTVISGSPVREAGETVAGGPYDITVGSVAVTSNYVLDFVNGNFTIGGALLTVIAANMSKTYGAADPTFDYSVSGLAPADTAASVLSGALARIDTSENVLDGPFAITQGNLLASGNYSINFTPAQLTIQPAALIVTASPASKVYGAADPALTFTDSGRVLGDTLGIYSGALAITGLHDNVGAYPIAQGSLLAGGNYAVTFNPGTLTISQKTINVIAANSSKIYGATEPVLTYTNDALVGADVFTGALHRIAGEHANTYAIDEGTLDAGGNYDLIVAPGHFFTIDKAPLTINAVAGNKVYGDSDPALTYAAVGLVNSDTDAIFSGSLTRAVNANVGTYPITVGTLSTSSPDYTVTYNSADFTITPKPMTVTADAKGKDFGAVDPLLTYSHTPLVNGDTNTVFSGALARAAGTDVGTYPITQGGLTAGANYAITFVGDNFIISEARLVINADPKDKIYGEADPVLTYNYSGLLNGDLIENKVSGNLARAAGTDAAVYAINQGTLVSTDTNYIIDFFASTFTIAAKPITVTPDTLSKVYGAAEPSALTYTHDTLVGADVFTGALSRDGGQNAGAYKVNLNTLALSANYDLVFTENRTFTIDKAPLTVTASPASKTYGTADPALAYGHGTLVNSDTATVFSGSLARAPGETVAAGPYAITQNSLSAGDNYTITYTGNVLTITPAALAVTANVASKTYGAADPAFTYNVSGLTNGDVAVPLSGALVRDPGADAGTYDILQGAVVSTSTNYAIAYTGADFTIDPAALTVIAAPQTKIYGDNDPTLSYSVSGLVNGDTAISTITGLLGRAAGENVADGPRAIGPGALTAGGNYVIDFTPNSLVITPKTLAVTAANTGKVYGAAEPSALTYTHDVLVSPDTNTIFTGALARAPGEDRAVYAIGQGNLAAGSNYVIGFTPGAFTISNALLAIIANPQSKIYGGTEPTLTYTATGFLPGEDESLITGLLERGVGTNVGLYPISVGSLLAPNYAISFTTANLEITPATLTITANDLGKTYGGTDPALTFAHAGLVNGDTASIITGGAARATGADAGTYAINVDGVGATANYTLSRVAGVFTIAPAALTLTANDLNKVYGAVDPTLTVSAIGLVNGDTVLTAVTGAPARAPGANVGTYAITRDNVLASANYTVSFVDGVFTINPAALTLTANDANKTYGAADPTLTLSATGLVNSDTLLSAVTGTPTRAPGANAGTYAITRNNVLASANYTVSFVDGVFTINPAALTLTANDANKIYGAADPTLTLSATGLVNSDTLLSAVTGTPARAPGANAGTYAITRNNVLASANYTVSFVDGVFTINPAALTLTANDANKIYGAVDPTLTLSATGLVNSDTLLSAVTGTPARAPGANAGTYAITRNNVLASANYTVSFVDGVFTINPAALTLTADSLDKVYGSTDPTLTVSASGLVNGDTVLTAVTGTPARALGANAGTYPITRNNVLATANYTVSFVDGIFTINPAVLTITADNLSKTYGGVDPTLTFVPTGLVNGDAAGIVTGAPARTAGVDAGTYPINVGTIAATANYTLSFVPGKLFTINPAALLIAAADSSKTYGAADPTLTFTSSGLVNGDLAGIITGAPQRAPGETVLGGPYAITQGSVAATANYTVTFDPADFTINPAPLTLTGVIAQNKIYDGNDSALLAGGTVAGVIGTDVVTTSAGTGTGTFNDKNVGTGKAVTVTGYVLGGADAGNYTFAQPTGLTANVTPKALTVTIGVDHKIYNGTAVATGTVGAPLGVISGDDLTLAAPTLAFADRHVGVGKAVTASALTLGGVDAANYTITAPTGLTANVTPKTLSVAGITAANKTYDATTSATFVGGALSGVISGDAVALIQGTGTFVDKNAGVAKAVTTTGFALGGADGGNYLVTNPSGLTADINQKALTITGTTANDKIYDGSLLATVSTGASALAGVLGGDAVTLNASGAAAAFTTGFAGSAKSMSVSGFTLGGVDSVNYALFQPTGVTASITPKPLPVIGVIALDKIFDNTAVATLDNAGAQLLGIVGTESVTLVTTAATGSFADANVGNGKPVTAIGYALAGADQFNYTVTQPQGLAAYISALVLGTTGTQVTGSTAANKAYDGTTAATIDTSNSSLVGLISGTNVTLVGSSAVGVFADRFVGTGKTVTITGFTLAGPDANNYVLDLADSTTADITPRVLDVTRIVADSKIYDATADASLFTGNALLAGTIGSDSIVLNDGVGVFGDKAVGAGKTVIATGFSLGGTEQANYTLVQPASLVASITPAPLTLTGVTADDKVYDATTGATLSGGSLFGAFGGDLVTAGAGTGTFDNKNAGADKAVTLTGYALGGADSGNYFFVQPTGLTADITPRAVTPTIIVADRAYDATAVATGTLVALDTIASGDDATVSTLVLAFADKDVGTGKTVTANAITIIGADAGNYTIATPTSLTASITPKALLVTGISASDKVYDTTTTAEISAGTLSGVLGSEAVVLVTGAGAFADKNAGTLKPVTASFTISGADASNYTVTQPALVASITPAPLTLGGVTAQNKIYDATNTAALSGGTLSGTLAGDDVTIGAGTGVFADKHAGTAKAVTVTGYTFGGADGGNYMAAAQPAGLTASITPAALSVTATGNSKGFDGNTSSAGLPAIVGLQGADTAVSSETYDTSVIGTGKAVTPGIVINDGNNGANYAVTLLVNNEGIITGGSTQSAALESVYRPTPIRDIFDANADGMIPVLRAVLIARRTLGMLTIASLNPLNAVGIVTVDPRVAVIFGPQNPLAPGQTFANVYSDGNSSNSNLVQVEPGLIRMRVSEVGLNLSEQFSLAAGNNSAAGITVLGEGSDIVVSMDETGGALEASAAPAEAAGAQLGVTMTGSGGHVVEFSVSIDNGLVIQPTGATAAAVFGAEPNGELLNLVMAQAIVTAATKLNATQIPAIRLLRRVLE